MKANTAVLRERLNSELQQVLESIERSLEATGIVELDQSSVGRVSRMDAIAQQAMAKGMQERLVTRQRKLRAAIARVGAGTYGACCECQVEMEPDRLDADPAAVFCSDCASEREAAK